MTEQGTAEPGTEQSRQTGLDRFFAAVRRIDLRRRSEDTWFRGVCSGLADRLGVDPVIVRAALVLLSLIGGSGITIYLLAWALVPNDREEIVAQRALRDADGASIVVVVLASLALFSGSAFGGLWWRGESGWGFPWVLALTGLLLWWLVQRSSNSPDADRRASTQQPASPYPAGPPAATAGLPPVTAGLPAVTVAPPPATSVPSQTVVRPADPRPRRRSGGPLMALLAIGTVLVTYGSLTWLGAELNWPGNHTSIALAGSLAAIGVLLVVLGVAGWRAGFVAFLAVILSILAWSSTVVPAGIDLTGRVGEATWTPTSVAAADANYHLGAGDGVLDLSGLPREGLAAARLPAYVGVGDLTVIVPEGLTVQVRGHVGLGEIVLPGDTDNGGSFGTDLSRTQIFGAGPTEVMVDAGVGVGQLTVVKE